MGIHIAVLAERDGNEAAHGRNIHIFTDSPAVITATFRNEIHKEQTKAKYASKQWN